MISRSPRRRLTTCSYFLQTRRRYGNVHCSYAGWGTNGTCARRSSTWFQSFSAPKRESTLRERKGNGGREMKENFRRPNLYVCGVVKRDFRKTEEMKRFLCISAASFLWRKKAPVIWFLQKTFVKVCLQMEGTGEERTGIYCLPEMLNCEGHWKRKESGRGAPTQSSTFWFP